MVSDNSSKNAANPPSNSSKVSFDSTLTPQRFLDVDALQTEWSPKEERIARSQSGGMKVRSLDGNKRRLRGGDFVLNKWDAAATIGFCFKDKTTKKKYGITVAHLADHCHSQTGAVLQEGRVGDKLYVFLSDEPDDTTGEYEKAELGKIVSLERSTDSMVFEVEGNIEVESYVLHPCLGLQTRISLGPFEMGGIGTTLVGFGAQRRGTLGRIMEARLDN
ncbi:expressed unknown protein [Seminavis robusta]|uniref:Uncharacterized protein n=1 Tax=Seminavis robusta TaxID=568900 RepID=A0A9N8DKI5_9STRA|nr:expressed unknown protein [Seminavis robusta]|eukprot:Sro133_g063060.1 n/a (219) ;mRNA; r:63960-64616